MHTDTPTAPAAAPAGRDLSLDLLRAAAVVFVTVGHWLVVVPTFDGGRFGGRNALGDVALLEPLTWLFQVMPLFFVVGGAAHTHSWPRARDRGEPAAAWIAARLVRLLRPTLVLLATLAVLVASLAGLGVDAGTRDRLGWVAVFPLWFLAVYVVVVVLAPALVAADRRWGWRVPGILAGAAALVDIARLVDHDTPARWLNFAFVFLACHAVGSRWVAGSIDRRVARWSVLGGVVLLVGGVAGPYSLAMVGVPGDPLANNAPPTLCLLLLGLVQAGVASLHRERLASWAVHPKVLPAVVALNLRAMSIFLWHMGALVLVAVVVLPLTTPADGDPGSAAWWATRLGWLPVHAVALLGILRVVGRAERSDAAQARPMWVVLPAALVVAGGVSRIAVGGVADHAGVAGLDLVALGAVALPSLLLLRRPATVRIPG